MKQILIIGCGGFMGAILRYITAGWIQKINRFTLFPYGTLGVNMIGCLLIGILGGMADNHEFFSPSVRMLLLVGVLGSFTTFSTFGYETLALIRDQQLLMAATNIMIHLFAGLLAVWLGYSLSQWA